MTEVIKQEVAISTSSEGDAPKPIQRIIEQLREASKDASEVVKAAADLDRDESSDSEIVENPKVENSELAQIRQILSHISWIVALTIAGLALVWAGNKRFAPFLFDGNAIPQVARGLADGKNYAVFDLNIDIRDLRNAHIATFTKAPEVVVLGASHWQEADASLLPSHEFYNSHVHRDYYEDMLAVTEMYIRHGKLPRKMIITIRDNLFTPVSARTDFLWLPGIKYYRVMALRLGLEPHSKWLTMPVATWRKQLSFQFLRENVARELLAPVLPHATRDRDLQTMDTLLPDGSIRWSKEHLAAFTQERARSEALAFADARRNDPPKIDPKGLKAIDALLEFLADQDIEVYLAHPPFNPIFYDAIRGSSYEHGLTEIVRVTKRLSDKYRLPIIGSFDPSEVGCSREMYIDAEHAGPECLSKILGQFARLDRANRNSSNTKARD